MIHYILLFVFPALIALWQPVNRPWKNLMVWMPVGALYILFVGLRDGVGGDWYNYLEKFYLEAINMTYAEAFMHGDPAYWLLSVWMHDLGWGIHGVNFISALLVMTGFIVFFRRLQNPWLGFTIAISYTLVVVVMGYVRQGIALAFIFWAIVALSDKKFFQFILLVLFAAAFHKTAVLMIGLGVFQQGKGKVIKVSAVILIGVGLMSAFISGEEERFTRIYITNQMESSGAYIRIFMNLIPSLIFFVLRKKWKKQYNDYSFWYMLALGSIVSVFVVGFSTTAVDRVALYFIPIQVIVFSRLPYLIQDKMSIKLTTFLIIGYYGLAYFVWLNFAANAYAWLPYDNLLLQYFFE